MPKITIELTEEESEFFRKNCFLRVAKRAADLLEQPEVDDPDDALWTAEELRRIGEIVESVRHKIVGAIFSSPRAGGK